MNMISPNPSVPDAPFVQTRKAFLDLYMKIDDKAVPTPSSDPTPDSPDLILDPPPITSTASSNIGQPPGTQFRTPSKI